MQESFLPFDIAAAHNVASRLSCSPEPDAAVSEVAAWLEQRQAAQVIGDSIRQAFDEVLDGQRTGRFDIDTLEKTEKTYLGTKVEIILRSAFGLGRGRSMDYVIAGHEVDSKFTVGQNWTIPSEADGHICLLVSANDRKGEFAAGILRISDDVLNPGRNRDGKRTLSASGRNAVLWITSRARLPENILLRTSQADREAIFGAGGGRSGQLRTDELFRRVQGRVINRNTVLTVARQDDSPKRVRDARNRLRSEGIAILGHLNPHPQIALALGLDVPGKGSWLSTALTQVGSESNRARAEINGLFYAVPLPGEQPTVPAPL
ncbi:NaeI family type II restriction endonuclease [Streptomyces sp. NBC_00691]|uniref:NaeI family type II restriction endonuclease n=1 Tax=Streptomyces sp. NBC_00691 TaxID=2903671 RepID=UPI002E33BDA5|nr:NaeI family type II restriction endonuclease [Streptomyces sp. NBC_00691]